MLAARRLSCRCHAHNGNRAIGAIEEVQRRIVGVAVQDEFCPMTLHDPAKPPDAEQPFMLRHGVAHWRMVDHHHPAQTSGRRFIQKSGQTPPLPFPQIAVGHEGRCGTGRRHTDQRDISAYPQIGEVAVISRSGMMIPADPIPVHPWRPFAADLGEGSRHIGVVVAGHHRDVAGFAQRFKPLAGHPDFAVQRQIDQITGDRDVIGSARPDICDNRVDNGVMHVTPAISLPVDVANRPLGGEFAIGYIGERTEMSVGQMRKPEHGRLHKRGERLFPLATRQKNSQETESEMNSSDPPAISHGNKRPGLTARLFHFYFLLRRPMTLGVRGLVHDPQAHTVLLVRHTYVPGWQLPGGGVEVGETMLEALERELSEEANIVMSGPPALISMHFNRRSSRRDHVGLYLIQHFSQPSPKLPDREIAEAGFFALDALPEETTPATRKRLSEVFAGETASPYW